MTPNEYQTKITETEDAKCFSNYHNNPTNTYLINNLMGLSGEVGELNEYVQKSLFHQKNCRPRIYAEDKDFHENICHQLGDILWYVAACCNSLGFSLEDVMKENINKLKERHPNGYTANYKEF